MRKICGSLLAIVLALGLCPVAQADEGEMLLLPNGSQADEALSNELETEEDGVCSSKMESALEDLNELQPGIDYIENRVLITFEKGVSLEEATVEAEILGFSDIETIIWNDEEESSDYSGVVGANCPKDVSMEDALRSLAMSSSVKGLELSKLAEIPCTGYFPVKDRDIIDPNLDTLVNDVYRKDQWYLDAVKAPEAWDTARCQGDVSVAVLDTGVEMDHPDLVNNIDADHAWDAVSNQPLVGDIQYHGTAVAGIISAQAGNWRGIAGVSYNAKIIPINVAQWVTEQDGSSSVRGSYEAMANGIERLLDDPTVCNLKVINISFSGYDRVPEVDTLQRAINKAYSRGVLVVASAGNFRKDNRNYPSDLDHVISVISTNKFNTISSSSNYGSSKDISAPGEIIYTTVSKSYADNEGDPGYGVIGGTSAAAPVVSGVLALIFAANPDLTAEQAENTLKSTAKDVGPQGFDSYYGWGIVDAKKAVETFTDLKKESIVSAEISGLENAKYTTNLDSLPIKVTLNGKILEKGVDYDVSYLNAGPNFMAEAVVKGKGAYRGIVSTSFFVIGTWERLSGPTALDTMVSIMYRGFSGRQYDSAIVVTMDGYWDALSASGLAGLEGCPVLLTGSDQLSGQTAKTIRRMGVKHVYVVGGTASVAPVVENQLMEIPSVVKVDRIAGDDATDTAVEIYRAGKGLGSEGWGDTAVLATSSTFHDALSGSPFSYAKQAPIFLTNAQKRLNPSSVEAIKSGGFTRVLILGGTASISNDVKAQLPGIEFVRLAGDDAMKTSVEIANFCISEGMSSNEMAVASGSTYYDAVTGAALCGSRNSVLLLVLDGDRTAITDFIAPRKSAIERGYIFGGTASVSDNLQLALEQAAADR